MTGRRARLAGRGSTTAAILLLLIGLPASGFAAWGAYQGWLTRSWPKTWATITDSDLKVRRKTEYRDGRRHTSTSVSVKIAYIYTVNGVDYMGDGLQPYSFGMQNAATARRLRQEHPAESRAEIIYSPEDPSISYLEPGPSSVAYFLFGVGSVLALIGACLLSLRPGRRRIL